MFEDADAYRGDLHRLLRLWQEYRLQVFAPEIGTREKVNDLLLADEISALETLLTD